jgi:hypothetical protein
VRRALALAAAVGLGVALFGLADPARSFARPDAIFWRIGLPLLLAVLAALFAVLPARGRLALTSLIFTLALLETGAALLPAPRLEAQPGSEYYRHDARLGWAPAHAGVFAASKRVDGKPIYATEYAIDAHDRRITPVADPDARDRFLLFFGGSCTFGEGVGAEETLPFFAGRGAPGHVPYNYGFHGYGPQHMLARLEDPGLRAHVAEDQGALVYLFIDAHVLRAIGSMRVYAAWADTAPHYALEADGRLVRRGDFNRGRAATALLYSLLGRSRTLERIGVDVPLRITDGHVELTAAIVARSRELFHERFGPQRFVVVAFPGSTLTTRLGAALERRGVELLDYTGLLDHERPGYKIPHDGHPTELTHRRIAERLVADLGIAGAGARLAESSR